ncbi:MAG: oxygen-dependent coproporphyrinogen oxidase [Flavobacteriales bacterium]
MKELISDTFKKIQQEICEELEVLDGKSTFTEDVWERDGGGGGVSRVIKLGNIIEKGGVNFSAVHGELPEALQKEFNVENVVFYATGVSIVLHSQNPFVPIIHMNIRYFELSNGTYWFGGGIDLTPHYVNPTLAGKFHSHLKNTCDKFHSAYYSKFKNWADDYFFITHRNETRGVGGIFFDQLKDGELSKQEIFDFVCLVGRTFLPAYSEQVQLTKETPFNENHKQWQLLRRGRYVEFNLVLDRGTKFGLQTSGRIESILMSLPSTAGWEYNFIPEANTEEEKTLNWLRKNIDWISYLH